VHVPRGERFNAFTHLAGAIATLGGLLVLVVPPLLDGEIKKVLGFAVYGVTLLLAYVASTAYHSARGAARDLYRRYDRMAIYLLIAGTYTPVTLLALPPKWGWPLLIAAWALAGIGSVAELFAGRQKKTLSVALYLFMGWMSLVALRPLVESLAPAAVIWLGAGGVLYTLGAINLRFALSPRSHEVWHVLVLAGSACHFAVMLFYVG
jgi:hemolysin III